MGLKECIDEIDQRGARLVANLSNLTGDAKAADALEAIALHLRGLFLLQATSHTGGRNSLTPLGPDGDCLCSVCVTIKRQAQEAAIKQAEADETRPMRLPKSLGRSDVPKPKP